jgi:hypothetical protein
MPGPFGPGIFALRRFVNSERQGQRKGKKERQTRREKTQR